MKPLKLRNILIVPFSLLIVVFSTLVGIQSLSSSQDSIEQLLQEIVSDTETMIQSELTHRMSILEHLNEINRQYVLEIDHQEGMQDFERLMHHQLNSFPGVDAVFYGDVNNEFSGFMRFGKEILKMYSNQITNFEIRFDRIDENFNSIETIVRAPNFYAEQRPWFKYAISQEQNSWGDVFAYHALPTLALPNSMPVIDPNNKLLGVVGNNLFLDGLSDFLRTLFTVHNGQAFIVNEWGMLIASTTLHRPYKVQEGRTLQIAATDSNDLTINNGWSLFEVAKEQTSKSGSFRQRILLNEQQYQLGVFKYNIGLANDWYIFIYLSEQGLLDQAENNITRSISFIISGMFITILLGAFLANRIAVPISQLNERVKSWKAHPLKSPEPVEMAIPVEEIQQLSDSTTQMQRQISGAMMELQKTIAENQRFITEIEKLAMVAENTDDMVLICDPRNKIEWANQSYLQTFGHTIESIKDRNAFELISGPNTQQEDASYMEELLREQSSLSLQQIQYDHMGNPHWVQLNLNQISNANGEVLHNVHIMQDITDQKTYENELAKWKTIFYSADWGIAILEKNNFKVATANPAFASMHGYAHNEIEGVNTKALYPPDVFETLSEYVQIAQRAGSVTFETTHVTKNGETFPVLQNISMIKDPTGELIGRIVSIQDISEVKSLQKQLLQSQKMEAMGTFAGGMAHDFNNILASIMGNAELGQLYIERYDSMPKEKVLEQLNERLVGIIKSSNRASDLTSKILSFSRMDTSIFSNVKMTELLDESIEMISPMLPTTIHIVSDVRAMNDRVHGNPSQLQQVLVNLITNAYQAILKTSQSGSIKITIDNVENLQGEMLLKILVEDTGCGMTQKEMEHIFDPFFTTKEKGKGTGLGLSVVAGIVRSHKGEVKVESHVNEGTIFKISFPAAEPLRVVDDEEVTGLPESSLSIQDAHVVMVDDETNITEVWSQILERKGLRVTTFNDPEAALGYISAHAEEVDLLISDFDMSPMNGEELCSTLHQAHPGLRMIMLTGYSERMDEERATKIGIKKLLLKPIRLNTLFTTIQGLIDDKN